MNRNQWAASEWIAWGKLGGSLGELGTTYAAGRPWGTWESPTEALSEIRVLERPGPGIGEVFWKAWRLISPGGMAWGSGNLAWPECKCSK